MAERTIDYREMEETFYLDQTDPKQVGPFRAWFHRTRFRHLGNLVSEFYKPGMKIADLGCGNCLWNALRLPVIGVDVNEKMLQWAWKNAYLKNYRICSNLGSTGLASGAFDIVVMSETLEHLAELPEVLREVRRILKEEGIFLITVPYDFFLSPFFVLFNIHCWYQGYLKRSKYHRLRCGHIHHFSKKGLCSLLANNGFEMKKVSVLNGLTLMAAAQKNQPSGNPLRGVSFPAQK